MTATPPAWNNKGTPKFNETMLKKSKKISGNSGMMERNGMSDDGNVDSNSM